MNILAFDTSSIACSVALCKGDQLFISHEIVPMQQARLLLPTIQRLLQEASLNLDQLDCIAYGSGPGSFTGIRIASSVVQGLAFACQKPILRISSLAAMAQAAYLEHGWKSLWIAMDARTEQIYWADYQIDSDGIARLEGAEVAVVPQKVPLPKTTKDTVYALGDGWEKYGSIIEERLQSRPFFTQADQLPTAEAILILAKKQLSENNPDFISVYEALPTYLR